VRFILRSSLLGILLAVTVVALSGCGDQGDRSRDAMPFMRIKLKNLSPPGGRPASARVTGTHPGGPGQTHDVGPVPPGAEQESQPPGEHGSDAVTIRVTFEGGPTFEGNGSYGGAPISTVDIDCAEPQGGEARVNFADGRPSETVPLQP
jgi:hypothetical protein